MTNTAKKTKLTSPQKYKRASDKRRFSNRALKSKIKTQIKHVINAIKEHKDNSDLKTLFIKAQSIIAHGASQGAFKKNKASRMTSSLNAKVKKEVLKSA